MPLIDLKTNDIVIENILNPGDNVYYVPDYIAVETNSIIKHMVNSRFYYLDTSIEPRVYNTTSDSRGYLQEEFNVSSLFIRANSFDTKQQISKQELEVIENKFDGIQELTLNLGNTNTHSPHFVVPSMGLLKSGEKYIINGLKHNNFSTSHLLNYVSEYVCCDGAQIVGPSVILMSKTKNSTREPIPFAVIPEFYIDKYKINRLIEDYDIKKPIKTLNIGHWYSTAKGTTAIYCGVIDGKYQFVQPKDSGSISNDTLKKDIRRKNTRTKLKAIKKHSYVTEHHSVDTELLHLALDWVAAQNTAPNTVGVV